VRLELRRDGEGAGDDLAGVGIHMLGRGLRGDVDDEAASYRSPIGQLGASVAGETGGDREVDDAFINMMKAKKVAITSTLVRELSSFVYADSPAWLNDPFLIRFSDPMVSQKDRWTSPSATPALDPKAARMFPGANGGVDVGGIREGDACERLAGGGVLDVALIGRRRRHPAAADVVSEQADICSGCHPGIESERSRHCHLTLCP